MPRHDFCDASGRGNNFLLELWKRDTRRREFCPPVGIRWRAGTCGNSGNGAQSVETHLLHLVPIALIALVLIGWPCSRRCRSAAKTGSGNLRSGASRRSRGAQADRTDGTVVEIGAPTETMPVRRKPRSRQCPAYEGHAGARRSSDSSSDSSSACGSSGTHRKRGGDQRRRGGVGLHSFIRKREGVSGDCLVLMSGYRNVVTPSPRATVARTIYRPMARRCEDTSGLSTEFFRPLRQAVTILRPQRNVHRRRR